MPLVKLPVFISRVGPRPAYNQTGITIKMESAKVELTGLDNALGNGKRNIFNKLTLNIITVFRCGLIKKKLFSKWA